MRQRISNSNIFSIGSVCLLFTATLTMACGQEVKVASDQARRSHSDNTPTPSAIGDAGISPTDADEPTETADASASMDAGSSFDSGTETPPPSQQPGPCETLPPTDGEYQCGDINSCIEICSAMRRAKYRGDNTACIAQCQLKGTADGLTENLALYTCLESACGSDTYNLDQTCVQRASNPGGACAALGTACNEKSWSAETCGNNTCSDLRGCMISCQGADNDNYYDNYGCVNQCIYNSSESEMRKYMQLYACVQNAKRTCRTNTCIEQQCQTEFADCPYEPVAPEPTPVCSELPETQQCLPACQFVSSCIRNHCDLSRQSDANVLSQLNGTCVANNCSENETGVCAATTCAEAENAMRSISTLRPLFSANRCDFSQ